MVGEERVVDSHPSAPITSDCKIQQEMKLPVERPFGKSGAFIPEGVMLRLVIYIDTVLVLFPFKDIGVKSGMTGGNLYVSACLSPQHMIVTFGMCRADN
jgi:hypothetical protein